MLRKASMNILWEMKLKANKYDEALEFLYSFIDYERNSKWKYDSDHFDLNRIEIFLSALDNPHKKGWFVHIAGTNGKGSVAAMIASALVESGYKTGLYTSPHLISFRERIKINGSMISESDVVEGVRRIKGTEQFLDDLTFFEIWTGLAFDYFARKKVDVSVIEVGIGGKLDTTNVVLPALSVITSISMDHRGKLGDTIEKVAKEKAGIIKPGIPVLSAPQDENVTKVIEDKAKESGVQLIMVGNDVKYSIDNNRISYSGLNWEINNLLIPLAGSFQHENAAVALTALEMLSSQGYRMTTESAQRGIENVQWPGRLQTVAVKPEIIVDGACNIEAMMKVRDYLLQKKVKGKIVAVVGMCSDKDVRDVLEIIGQAASQFVFTQADNPRAINAHAFAKLYRGKNNIVETDPVKAVKSAISMAGTNGIVIVTGSLYLVGEILNYYRIKNHN